MQFFPPGNQKLIQRFIESTINLYFKNRVPWGIPPDNLLQIDRENNSIYTSHILLVTHIYDPHTVSFLLNAGQQTIKTSAILNLTAIPEKRTLQTSFLSELYSEGYSSILFVSNPESIKEDLA